MQNNLEGFVVRLHNCLTSVQNAELARSIVSDIICVCGENMNPQTISICLSIFFNREKNLLSFLKKAITRDELRNCKIELLQFLHRFIAAAGKPIFAHVVDIKDTCRAIFNSEKYSDVRCCTFPIISKIIEMASGNSEIVDKLCLNKLADEYFMALSVQSKLTSSLKASIMIILGQMCRYQPEVMNSYSEKCIKTFLVAIKTEMKTKSQKGPDFSAIAGALEGINNYLYNFTQSAEENSEYAWEIFDCTRKALLANTEELTRYAMPRAALDLLAKHAGQFDQYIYDDYADIFDRISNWTRHKNYDLKKLAYVTLDAFYKELAEMLSRKVETERSKCEKIFKMFFGKFCVNLMSPDRDLKETMIAIKGYGAFAGPCRQFMDNEQMKKMFLLIIDLCERTFFSNQQNQAAAQSDAQPQSQPGAPQSSLQVVDIFDEKIYQLPAFIESLAYVCTQIDENLPDGSVTVLEKLIVLAIDSYPKLVKRYNYQISLAIARLFISIQLGKASFYAEFISRIIYQCMVRIFSYKTNYSLQQEQQFERLQLKIIKDEEENMEDDEAPIKNLYNITSTDYVMFWSNLLNLCEFKELNSVGIHINEKKKLIAIIYDEFIETLLKIMKKLDLNATKVDANEANDAQQQQQNLNNSIASDHNLGVSSNPTIGLKPSKPRDFEILVNLVDFGRELLLKKHFELFEKWMFKFSKEIIVLSSKYPLISGFYKLNTLCMKIAIKIGYFNNVNETSKKINSLLNQSKTEQNGAKMDTSLADSDEDEDNGLEKSEQNTSVVSEKSCSSASFNDSLQTDDDFSLKYEKVNCFFLYKKYVKEIFIRMKQFKDELLVSCLEFLLALPKELAVHNLEELFHALSVSLDIGINYFPIADDCLNSLEYWLRNIKLDKLKPYYPLVLKKFDDYLQMNRKVGGADTDVTDATNHLAQAKVLNVQFKYNGRGRRKLPVKLFEKSSMLDGADGDLYLQIQLRILKILGQLAGEMSHSLFETAETDQIIAWDTVNHLKFYVPFVDIKPAIYFDKFLPRIVSLALSSTNRQTKVNACELLHSIVVYMIGKSVSDPKAVTSSMSSNYQLNRIYKKIYPAVFRLACDIDQFARNLFQPFVMQIIHWFTGNTKYESLETVELLNCIMDGLVDEKDAALRDFSASALKEFLKWSIKHTPLARQDSNSSSAAGPISVNVKSILKRIFSFLTHPNCSKRLGAALAWNSIYVLFREEESLVNKHIFELLYYLTESLALAEKDDKMYGTQEHCIMGLDHVERIIRVKSDLLNQRNNERVKPAGWSEAILEVAVRWLMRQCGRMETECRHKAMDLVYKLSPCITSIKEPKEYFQIRLRTESEMYFLARFEGSSETSEILKDSLSNYKTLPDLGKEGQSGHLSMIHTWLSMLTAPLDCYTWVFGRRLLTPTDLFGHNKSCIWTSLAYFVENIINADLVDLVRRVYYSDDDAKRSKRSAQMSTVCTPNELERYRSDKCTAIVRMIDFLSAIIANYPSESVKCIPNAIWSEEFFKCLVNLCLDPQAVGFNLSDFEVFSNLPVKTHDFLKLFTQHMPKDSVQKQFKQICTKMMNEKNQFESIINESSTAGSAKNLDWIRLTQLINGYEQLNEFNIYTMPANINKQIFSYLYEQSGSRSYPGEQQESLTCIEAKRKLFNLCLNINFTTIKKSARSRDYDMDIDGGEFGKASKPLAAPSDYLIEILDEFLFENGGASETDKNKKANSRAKFMYYKNEICTWIYKRHEQMLAYIFSKLKLNFKRCMNLLVSLVEHLTSDKHLRKSYGNKIVTGIYASWHLFRDYWASVDAELENKILLISLLTKCNLIELVNVSQASSGDASPGVAVAEMFMSLLVDKKTGLNFKCKVLDLLHLFIDSPAPYSLKTHLNQFIGIAFPLRSSELIRGNDDYTDYVNAVRKLLVALELTASIIAGSAATSSAWTSSFDLLNIIVNIQIREREHMCDDEIQNALVRFMKRIDTAKQLAVLKHYWENSFKIQYDVFHNPEENERKFNLFRKVLMVSFQNCDRRVFIEFLSTNVIYILNTIDTEIKPTTVLASNYEQGVDSNGYMIKKCLFEIMELAYKRLNRDDIYSSSAKLCQQYECEKFGQIKDGKELTKEVLRKCRKFIFHEDAKLNDLVANEKLDDKFLNLKRQMHCSAYNCLVALFIRTQTEPKLYLAFLFKDDPNKNEFVFEPLVDKSKTYKFDVEIENSEERKIKFIALRNQFNEDAADAQSVQYIASLNATNSMMPNNDPNHVSYLNTQNLYESSLSEELSAFDFTGVANVRPSSSMSLAATSNAASFSGRNAYRKKSSFYLNSSSADSSSAPANLIDEVNEPIEVELDELNGHESMGPLVELIQSLVKNKITPIYENGQQPSEMPLWMQFFHRKISDIYTHENVKLLLIRVILNTKHVFKSYAKFWFAPLISFLVSSSLSREPVMDYFTLEVVALLISWKKSLQALSATTPTSPNSSLSSTQSTLASQTSVGSGQSESRLINRLFESLMNRCYHDNRQILKNNLELLKIMTECWKEHMTVPVGIINEFLTSIHDQKKVVTGIQLYGVVLANGIESYDFPESDDEGGKSAGVTRLDFYKALIRWMSEDSKKIHAPSAEVTGMLLKQLDSKKKSAENDEIFNSVIDFMIPILRKLDESKFITCVHRIQLNWPPISANFMSQLTFFLPSLYGEFKIMCAESILSSIKQLQDPLFKTKGFMDMLEHRESALQLICLKMINELLSKQTEDDLVRLMPSICQFVNHPHVPCRYQMLVILINIFEMYQSRAPMNEDGNALSYPHAGSTTEAAAKIKRLTNEVLLKALIDTDQAIRLMIQNFWIEKANMPNSTIERMILIMQKMYSPQTELEYLSYSTNLLLEKTSKSPDYNHLIYENPLSECVFRDYNLTADWRRRHEMMTPLFVDSMFSSMGGTLADQPLEFSNSNPNNLRATQLQSLQFQATQLLNQPDFGGGNQVKAPYNWLTQSSMDTLQASLVSSSLASFDSTQQSSLLFTTANSSKRAVLMSMLARQNTNESALSDDISRLRRRFLKDNAPAQAKFFSRKHKEKVNREEEFRRQLKIKRANDVQKYRQYRIGDFPDIQIKFWELIAPLQALAQRDSQVAMMLFESLFASILSEITYMNDDESRLVLRKIEENLNGMLNASDMFNPNFIACVLEIALKHAASFRLDIGAVSTACLNSYLQSLGIVLIEEYLIIDEQKQQQSRHQRADDDQPLSKRAKYSSGVESRGAGPSSSEATLWIELAKLYRSMNDYDSIKGIFSKKANLTTEYTKKGFNYESNNDYNMARKTYDEALSVDWSSMANKPSKLEEELWEQSVLRCCNEMTDWKEMCERTTRDSSLAQLFDTDSYSLEHLFPYAFRSKLKIILQEDIAEQKKHQDLLKFIGQLTPESKQYIEQTFAQEMSLISLHQKDYNAAKYYAHMAIQRFLMEWSSINKTILKGRQSKLQSLQSIVELNEFLKFIDSNPSYSTDGNTLNKRVENLVDLWLNSMPNIYSDPPCTWDDVITNRCIYFEYIEDKFYRSPSLNDSVTEAADVSTTFAAGGSRSFNASMRASILVDEDEDDLEKKRLIINKLEKSKIFMKIKIAQAAQCQGNNKLALNRLQQTRAVLKSENQKFADLKLIWMHCYLNTHLSRAKSNNDPEEGLSTLFSASALKELQKYDKDPEFLHRVDLHQDHQILHGQFSNFMVDSLLSIEDLGPDAIGAYVKKLENDERKASQVLGFTRMSSIGGAQELVEGLIKHGVEKLNTVRKELRGSFELSKFCDKYLRLAENNDDTTQASSNSQSVLSRLTLIKDEFPAIVVQQLLNSIRLNSYEARQRFPRLLQIVESYPDKTLDLFIKETDNIPCWMFLGWLSQMTALLDKPQAKAVYNIVQSISDEYPQAFVYPFKTSMEGFKFDYSTREQERFVESLKAKMNHIPLINNFIAALEQLTNPDFLCKDYLLELKANIRNRDALYRLFKDLYMELIDHEDAAASKKSVPSSQTEKNYYLVEWGNMKKNFSKFMKPKLVDEFGVECRNISGMNEIQLREKIDKMIKAVLDYQKTSREGNLGDFSPWLKSFKRNVAKDIEIPGQYSGKSKPMIEYHVKIEGFDERMITMSSLRRPKCITIRGNDQKEHRFLVKGGEDQRQDQRIQTLFELINDLLKVDSHCYQRNLSLHTYQVIPMTTKLALIEWIPETRVLKDVILNSTTEDEQRDWNIQELEAEHFTAIEEASKNIKRWEGFARPSDTFGVAYMKFKRDYACEKFNEIQNRVPMDLLKRCLRSMSINTESYFVLRNQFILSYAVACTCQYILGIGDRHLNNWMLDMKSGKAIGIDFGMAFGQATMNIGVPELMPIRLTRQILKLMAPLEHRGLLESSMIHTMRALRENNDLLMCILDVFIKEPSIDWIGNAQRIAKRNLNDEMQYDAGVQYAQSRIRCVKDKLDGINPCVITRNDLKNGIHKESRYIQYFINVAMGLNAVAGDDDRNQEYLMERTRLFKEKGELYRLTAEEQVRCIIEQSIDPDVLFRAWTGWNPFI